MAKSSATRNVGFSSSNRLPAISPVSRNKRPLILIQSGGKSVIRLRFSVHISREQTCSRSAVSGRTNAHLRDQVWSRLVGLIWNRISDPALGKAFQPQQAGVAMAAGSTERV